MSDEARRLHLHKCTVRLRIGSEQGTGFFVAPGLILTCAHVVAGAGSRSIDVFWKTENQNYTAKVEQLRNDWTLDLALLRLEAEVSNHPCVDFEEASPQTDDDLYIFGYPKDCYEDYSDGDSASFKYEGESFKGDVLWHKLKAGQIKEGSSGSPLLNLRTGGVCGIVNISRSTTSDLGGRAVSAREILWQFQELAVQKPTFQRIGVNPFEYGKPVSPEYFYGRRKAIADVKNRIGGISAQCINIVGQRRNGKSSLLRYIKECTEVFCQPEQKPLILTLDLTSGKFHTPEGILEGLRREITKLTGTEPWSQNVNDDPYEVEDGLQVLCDNGQRLIVMLDEFEAIGKRLEVFQDWGDDWRAKASAGLLTMVIASKRPVSEVYEILNLTSPFSNIFSTTILGALEEEAWHSLVLNGFSDLGSQGLSLLPWIDNLAGGLPFYTQMAAALLWQYDNPEEAKAEFIDQATPRFGELWRDLTPMEKQALRHAAGISGLAAPNLAITDILQRHGLLRLDRRLFSSAFAEFVKEQ